MKYTFADLKQEKKLNLFLTKTRGWKPSVVVFFVIMAIGLVIFLHRSCFTGKTTGPGETHLRFALCQYGSRSEGPEYTFRQAMAYAEEAVACGAKVVIFPEYSFISYDDLRYLHNWRRKNVIDDWTRRIADFTSRHQCYLLVNHPVDEDEKRWNETRVFGPDGAVAAVYRKRVPSLIDLQCGIGKARPQDCLELPFGSIGMLVCKDSLYPQRFQSYNHADVIICQYAHVIHCGHSLVPIGLQEKEPFPISSIAPEWIRAYGKPMLMVNKSGHEGEFSYLGGSALFNYDGKDLKIAGSGPQILYVDFKLDQNGRIQPETMSIPDMPAAGVSETNSPLFSLSYWQPRRCTSDEVPGPGFVAGRRVEWFCHDPDPNWGDGVSRTRYFALVHPAGGAYTNAPLALTLHSHGYSPVRLLETLEKPGDHDVWKVPDEFFMLVPDCSPRPPKDSPDFWWCGINHFDMPNAAEMAKTGLDTSPCEKRVLDTLKWVLQEYSIDRNRVYACGNSMGGQGVLGICLNHGDIFAAVRANVPAGIRFAAARLGFSDSTGEDVPLSDIPFSRIPDPPVCVEDIAPNDSWARDHGVFLRNMARCRYPLVAYWGLFGHANSTEILRAGNDLIGTFDWLSVRRDEAYPVFTEASCDDVPPWMTREDAGTDEYKGDESPGQINGFFRWQAVADIKDLFSMDIWIESQDVLKTQHFVPPTEAAANVSIRRFQHFQHAPGQRFHWRFGDMTGDAVVDANGLVTIPGVSIGTDRRRLTLETVK